MTSNLEGHRGKARGQSRLRIRVGRRFYRWARALYGLSLVASDPDFDTCVHCDESGCEDGTVEHKPDCPSVTGVYPVLPIDVWPEGMLCDRCKVELWPGDSYSLIPIEPQVYEVACVGCAVLAGSELARD